MKNKIVWLFEKDLWQEENDAMKRVVNKLGYEWREIKYIPFSNPDYSTIQKDGEICIFYGSLNLARHLRPHITGVFCNLQKFECTNYYPYYEEYLLNNQYIMCPFGSLEYNYKRIFELFYPECCFGPEGTELFIRPSSGFKLFTGQTISFDSFERDFQRLGYNPVDSDKIVILSPLKNIEKEWRVVIVNGKAITSSVYKVKGYPIASITDPEDEDKIHGLAEQIAKKYSPEEIFCIDIGLCSNLLELIEVNSFSCSGLYKCDKEAVVKNVSLFCQDVY